MVFGIKRRKQIMRLLGKKTSQQRKRNQQRGAARELTRYYQNSTPHQIKQTIRERKQAAIEAYQRTIQLRSMKKVLAENPKKAMGFFEMAINATNPSEQAIAFRIAEVLSNPKPGQASTQYVKDIIRGMNNPTDRRRILDELKRGVTPELKALADKINRLRKKNDEKK